MSRHWTAVWKQTGFDIAKHAGKAVVGIAVTTFGPWVVTVVMRSVESLWLDGLILAGIWLVGYVLWFFLGAHIKVTGDETRTRKEDAEHNEIATDAHTVSLGAPSHLKHRQPLA